MTGFSLFRSGNASPEANNLSLLRKISKYLENNNQLALFPKYQYTYRIYFTNTDWDKHKVVHFYRQRGDAENVIKEEKEGFAVEKILLEDFLANAAIFQMQLLAYNLVQYFKYTNLKRSWWNLRIKQLRFRLINMEKRDKINKDSDAIFVQNLIYECIFR